MELSYGVLAMYKMTPKLKKTLNSSLLREKNAKGIIITMKEQRWLKMEKIKTDCNDELEKFKLRKPWRGSFNSTTYCRVLTNEFNLFSFI